MRFWNLPNDFTGDGVFTISDVSAFFEWFFTYPGDHIVRILINTDVGRFFEFSTLDYGGPFSWIWSLIAFTLPYYFIKEEYLVNKKRSFFETFWIIIFSGGLTGLWLPFLILFGANV